MEGCASLSLLGYLKGEKWSCFLRFPFSLTRLKLSFSSFLALWAGLIPKVDLTVIRIILCILSAINRS